MNYDPFIETMLVERSMDKIDQVEMEKEIERLREDNASLKKQLGYKKTSSQFYNYEELVEENINLKQKLGYSKEEAIEDIKNNSPYRKSNAIWWVYIISSILLFAGFIIASILIFK